MPDGPEAAAEETVEEPAEVRSLPEHPILKGLIEPFVDAEWLLSAGQHVVILPKDQLGSFGEAAKAAGFEMAVDVTAVDYLGKRRVRFEVVANLLSVEHALRLRVRCPVPADDTVVPSLVPTYPGANFFEREIYDMFGITFDGHPDMTRILMPDDWVGHPLRKDFGIGDVPVQFKEANKVI
ncbi:MAG: NADH-quinone oxidoreductase subunit C [Acidimicrobiia bacterium]|nr:NADH-quinone oxidoreductase subunit C [Acidimicrobiia bacterium]